MYVQNVGCAAIGSFSGLLLVLSFQSRSFLVLSLPIPDDFFPKPHNFVDISSHGCLNSFEDFINRRLTIADNCVDEVGTSWKKFNVFVKTRGCQPY